MRLLHTIDLRAQDFVPSKAPSKYAILSHTWEEEEITLQDMEKGVESTMKGYLKLRNSCQRAAEDGYEWIWIDTCCIDKTSSAELSEAINSMFEYYGHSAVCYAYLADIESLEALEKSRWFTRGWTLQELLAPPVVIFFDGRWRELGTKQSLFHRISSRTGIPEEVVLGKPVQACNTAQRMSWASQRQTTREEDIAYCLLGLFGIHMSPIYGEGAEKAFLRLQEEILHQSADHTLFIWTPEHDPYNQGLLASSPRAFCTHPECFIWMRTEHRAKQRSFDPYAYLRRVSNNISKQLYKADEKTGRTGLTPIEDPEHSASASLGQSGLQISLLSHIRDESKVSRLLGADIKVLCFHLLLDGTDSRDPVHLKLVRDMEVSFVDGFAPNRLGTWRRLVSSTPGASYIIEPLELSFERVPITISQIKTPIPYSGPPLTFAFRGQQSEALFSHVLLAEPRGFSETISRPRESFRCRGGIVIFQHSCTQCDPQFKVVLVFGGHGKVYQPWCYAGITKVLGEDESSMRDLYKMYESIRHCSARYGVRSSTYVSCKMRIGAQIDFGADKGCYFITLTSVREETYSVR